MPSSTPDIRVERIGDLHLFGLTLQRVRRTYEQPGAPNIVLFNSLGSRVEHFSSPLFLLNPRESTWNVRAASGPENCPLQLSRFSACLT